MNETDNRPDRRAVTGGKLVFGLVLLGLGLFFLLDRFAVIDIDVPWGWWPLVLVALGVGKLLDGRDGRDRQGGVWLIVIGVWLILNFEGYFGLDWDNSWPLLLVAAGAMIVWRALRGGHEGRPAKAPAAGGGDEPAA
jgi:hypothetical protein